MKNTKSNTLKKTMSKSKNTARKSKNNVHKSFNIIHFLMHLLNVIKIHHWETISYPTHEATDGLYEELNELIDSFVEVLLGKTGIKRSILIIKPVTIESYNIIQLKTYIEKCKKTLNELTSLSININDTDTDLLNIRDEILASLNKFTYLLTLK